MPLDKAKGIDLIGIPYETKVAIVESNCVGCGWFKLIMLEEEVFPVYGCLYPTDLMGRNPYLQPKFLDVIDIAINTCLFWRGRIIEPEPEIDSTPGNEQDWKELVELFDHDQFTSR